MTGLLIFILIAYGATNIMIHGSIFSGWRKFWGVDKEEPGFFGKLFGCFMCLPFYWGVIISLTLYSPSYSILTFNMLSVFGIDVPVEYISVFFDACLSSGAVWVLNNIEEAFERFGNN